MRFARIAATLTAFAVVGNARTCTETEVVILGAGVAGVTAAETLHKNGVEDFIVLEYQDRIGGRMHEVTFGKGQQYVVEAGANWVHGTGGPETHVNPIWDLAIKANLRTLTSDVENATVYDQTGEIPPELLFNALKAVSDADSKVLADAGIRLHHHLEDRTYRAALRRQGWNPKETNQYEQLADYLAFDSVTAAKAKETSEIYTAVTTNATAKFFSHREEFSFDQRGFSIILRNVADPLFEGQNAWRLRKNTIVKEIEHDDDSVTVHSTDGKCVRAKYAIMTFSLGVLQHPEAVKFTPELPRWKKDAITSFEMVTYTKIFMQFPHSFWPKNQYLYYADPNTRGYYPLFQPLDVPGVLEGSNILVVTVVNDQAYRVERQSEDKTQAEIMEVLRKIFGDETIPEPIGIFYARWTQMPW
ncbi:hypothetical protein AtubIFM56815_009366 [Aspergillus tubingensis]|nr:hypothetical protein AtubIFM54640_010044 [Aspergillus tubingensis]GLA85138.1 hypothetical protein AtubIFM56815_009366 [Aspergillus tubingensis]GLA93200.1 hypothetical protein AtubIFM57143_010545 [Aspergillus tubingensis]GLB20456.1 hypothetical protein AtubIFM61612_010391 [Aspergillus tubingensis]